MYQATILSPEAFPEVIPVEKLNPPPLLLVRMDILGQMLRIANPPLKKARPWTRDLLVETILENRYYKNLNLQKHSVIIDDIFIHV